ncbi:hypothetical protein ABZV29_34590 [Streptomyces sp. NPDC005236]|uniref:hypothetical protein n=1 Tax=Streptomyces sp. NPDC005236 TaxID=3157028 RepID=UPI0033A23997
MTKTAAISVIRMLAIDRAISRQRIGSDRLFQAGLDMRRSAAGPSSVFGVVVARPDGTARAAASVLTASVLPRLRLVARSGWLISMIWMFSCRRKRRRSTSEVDWPGR